MRMKSINQPCKPGKHWNNYSKIKPTIFRTKERTFLLKKVGISIAG
jgi:hypothetical protein